MTRRVLVTGGASGIGAACVRRFQADGCTVAVLDRDQRQLATSPAEVKIACDVSAQHKIFVNTLHSTLDGGEDVGAQRLL